MKHQKLYVVLLVVLVLLLAGVLAWYIWFVNSTPSDTTNNNTATEDTKVNDEENNSVANGVANDLPANTTTNNTVEEEDNNETSKSGNITITSPKANASVKNSFSVSGYANVFEGVVQIRVKDANGIVLLETYTTTNAPDAGKTGTFKKAIVLEEMPTSEKGTVESYASSPKDGSEQDLVSVAITFSEFSQQE